MTTEIIFFFSLLGYSTSMNKILLWNILFYKNSGLTKMGHPVVYLGSRSSALSEHSRNRRHTREVIQREVSPHIYNENTESQRGELSCPRSPKQWVVDSRGLKPGKQVYSETSSFLFFFPPWKMHSAPWRILSALWSMVLPGTTLGALIST